jgi:hypothetical protein
VQIWVVISPEFLGAAHLAQVLDENRRVLPAARILFPRSPGKRNHTRLPMAVLDPSHRLHLRSLRGLGREDGPDSVRALVLSELGREVRTAQPERLILVAAQLFNSLTTVSELERLHGMLSEYSRDIRFILHVDEPAKVLIRHYGDAVARGRTTGLDQELTLAKSGQWFKPALDAALRLSAPDGPQDELDLPPFWLDFAATIRFWESVFGLGAVKLADGSGPRRAVDCALDLMGIKLETKAISETWDAIPDEWMARNREINGLFRKVHAAGLNVDRRAFVAAHLHAAVSGPVLQAGALSPVSALMSKDISDLTARAPDLAGVLKPDDPLPDWQAPDPTDGFRVTQFAGAVMAGLDERNAAAEAERSARTSLLNADPELGERIFELPPEAKKLAARMAGSRYAPHNALIRDTADAAPPFVSDIGPPPDGQMVLAITCMKNEGPFILEWVAHHRAIGIRDFLIYTNDCDDGTDELLDCLQGHGILTHRLNNEWKGKSPQQAALNKAQREDLFRAADWVVHFDVDEFINIKTGNGRIHDLLAMAPGAGAFTLTWRTFGHNGVIEFKDEPIIGQFTAASPSYCPKPHTAWGFKTLFRNSGAYRKLSCHRPNQIEEDMAADVVWVNGSGVILPDVMKAKGWRSDIGTIGYDLVQLNHYPLRSAESFLVKRKRGRALHVERSIGRNYWIRNDWNDFRDVSVLRNLPRVQGEIDALRKLEGVAALHDAAVARHREKIAELRGLPEFEELLEDATSIRLNPIERAAYSLMLDIADRR